jgi:uncharacterized protein YndB with AHSA1/START domain
MESNTKDRELLITRTLNAPVELVWEVWTKPEHIATGGALMALPTP